jgi:hypothetical protein
MRSEQESWGFRRITVMKCPERAEVVVSTGGSIENAAGKINFVPQTGTFDLILVLR